VIGGSLVWWFVVVVVVVVVVGSSLVCWIVVVVVVGSSLVCWLVVAAESSLVCWIVVVAAERSRRAVGHNRLWRTRAGQESYSGWRGVASIGHIDCRIEVEIARTIAGSAHSLLACCCRTLAI